MEFYINSLKEYKVNGEKLNPIVNGSKIYFLDWVFDIDTMTYKYIKNGEEGINTFIFSKSSYDDTIYDLITSYKELEFSKLIDWFYVERTKNPLTDIYEYTYKGENLATLDSLTDFDIEIVKEIERELK